MNKKKLFFLFAILTSTFLQSVYYSQYYYNKAASFNGSTSYIAIPNHAELNPTNAITIEAWVYPKNLGCVTFVAKRYTKNYWFGSCENNNKLRFYPKGGSGLYVDGNTSLQMNKWYHVAATYDGTTTKLYINGQLDIASTSISGALTPNLDSLYIGADIVNNYMTYFYTGYIDNVRIWNVARTQQQIQNNMYITLQMNKPTGNYSGLVAAYNLDWEANDMSGNISNDGLLRNITLIDFNGKPLNYVDYNTSLVLDGNSYCATQNSDDFNATSAITLEAWIKRDLTEPQPGGQIIIQKGNAVGNDYGLALNGSSIFFVTNSGTGAILIHPDAIVDNAWHHVAATYNSTDGIANLYVNGIHVANSTNTPAPINNTTTDSLFIGGAHPNSTDASFKFKGQIDEVRVWKNIVRTQQEIKAEMLQSRGHNTNTIPPDSYTYAFGEYTNWATAFNSHNSLPLNFRGNAIISSSHLQNDYTAPIISENNPKLLNGFTISTNKRTIIAGGTVLDSVNISTTGTVNSVQAFMLLNHGAVGKLSMSLISPTGVTVSLLPPQNSSLNDHDIMTIFDPAADSSISFTNANGLKAPFSPKVKPYNNFTVFNGELSNGWWKIRITDATSGTMLRVLNGWGLKLGITPLPNPPNAPTATAATNIGQTSFTANWNSVNGATGYYLDVATNNTFTNFVTGFNNKSIGNVLTYQITGLSPNTPHYYRVRSNNLGGTSGNSNVINVTLVDIGDENNSLPLIFELGQNYPNPFNPNTTIKYSLAKEEFVSLKIYDPLGKEVADLVNERKPQGKYEVNFNAEKLVSGIYFYKIVAGNFVAAKKLVLIK